MCVCMYEYLCVCACMCVLYIVCVMCVCVWLSVFMCVHVRMSVCIMCVSVCLRICACIFMCIVCMCGCVFLCVRVCVSMCVFLMCVCMSMCVCSYAHACVCWLVGRLGWLWYECGTLPPNPLCSPPVMKRQRPRRGWDDVVPWQAAVPPAVPRTIQWEKEKLPLDRVSFQAAPALNARIALEGPRVCRPPLPPRKNSQWRSLWGRFIVPQSPKKVCTPLARLYSPSRV